MPQRTEEAGVKGETKGRERFEQLKPNMALNPERIYEYKLMVEEQFRRYGPTKSRIVVKTKKKAASPLIAGIDSNNWDVKFVIDEGLRFREDPELLKYLERRNVVDPVKELLRTVAYHEMGHWEFPRGTQFGCPYDKTRYYASFIEPIHEELKNSGKNFSDGFCKAMSGRIANAVMDVIDNYNMANSFAKIKEDTAGQMLFWYLQGQEGGNYDAEYSMFVRLNLSLFGEKEDANLLRRFFLRENEVNKSVANLEKVFTPKAIYSKEKWEELAREYTKEAIKHLKADETPTHQHSPDDRSAKGRKNEGGGEGEEGERGKGDGPKGGAGQGSEEGETAEADGEAGEGEGGSEAGKEGEEEGGEETGDSGEDSGEKEGDEEGESKGGSEQEGEEEGEGEGSGSGKDSEQEGEEGKGEGGAEEKEDGEGEKPDEEDEEDKKIGFGGVELGSDLSPDDIEKIMGGRALGGKGMSPKGVPFYIKTDEALDAFYRHLAKGIPLKAEGKLPAGNFPIIPETRERFDPEVHSFEDADGGKLFFDPMARVLAPSVVKTRMNIGIPIRKEKKGLPDFVFSLIDSSGSMWQGGGRKELVPWGDESYYHYALLTFWGLLRFFEMERMLHKIDISAAIFSSTTLDQKGLKEVKKMLLNPASGGTEIDMAAIIANLRGRQNAVFSFITDGGICNWGKVKQEFIEIAKRNQFFMIQIGDYKQTANELTEEGLGKQIYFVNKPKDIVNLAIDLTVKRYRAAVEKSAEKDKKRFAREFGK